MSDDPYMIQIDRLKAERQQLEERLAGLQNAHADLLAERQQAQQHAETMQAAAFRAEAVSDDLRKINERLESERQQSQRQIDTLSGRILNLEAERRQAIDALRDVGDGELSNLCWCGSFWIGDDDPLDPEREHAEWCLNARAAVKLGEKP